MARMHAPASRLVASLLFLLALAPTAGAQPEDPLATGISDEAQVIGWSADEKRFAVRVYGLAGEDDSEAESPFCPGYVDHKGKKFRGSLTLAVYEEGKLLTSFRIQEWECTPPEQSRARLAEAKAEFAKLGIDMTKPGTEVLAKGTKVVVKEGPGTPYTLEYVSKLKQKNDPKDPALSHLVGKEEVMLRQGKEKRAVYSRPLKVPFEESMGAHYHLGLSRVWVSPSKAVVVLVGSETEGGMRGSGTKLRLRSVLTWGGEPLVLR
jgi:hypothetical protein